MTETQPNLAESELRWLKRNLSNISDELTRVLSDPEASVQTLRQALERTAYHLTLVS